MLGWKEVNRGRGQIVGYEQSCHLPEGLVLVAGRGACPIGPWFFPRHVRNRRVLHRGNNIFLENHRNGMEGVRAIVFPFSCSFLTFSQNLQSSQTRNTLLLFPSLWEAFPNWFQKTLIILGILFCTDTKRREHRRAMIISTIVKRRAKRLHCTGHCAKHVVARAAGCPKAILTFL